MNFIKSFSLLAAVFLPVIFTQINATQTSQTDNHSDETQLLSFSAKQMQMADIQVGQITAKYMDKRLYAPGEVQANGYTSYVVSPRVESVIVRRHAILGEHVEQGQALVTLFSEDVAQAQAKYRIAYADWQRARSVSKDVISESQRLSAETDYIAAFSRLKAYGLSKQAIELIAQDNSSALGEYTLKAERSGSVLSDDFQQGQRVSAGDSIMVLTDESELWVEARLAANNSLPLSKGTKAQVILTASQSGESSSYQAQVIQQAHTIDPKTRTRVVRLKVKNTNHQLHPGLFVDVYFSLLTPKPVLVVPETALLRSSDGDWIVYRKSDTANQSQGVAKTENHSYEKGIEEAGHVDEAEHSHQADKHKPDKHTHNEVAKAENHKYEESGHGDESEDSHEEIAEMEISHVHGEHSAMPITFVAQEVQLGAVFRVFSPETKEWLSWREVTGIAANSHVAMTGAFFIASQGAKSGFDAHNH